MTKIRKINVSQVEGTDANNTDITEIRPFGETAFYLDTSGNTNKLALMMFDGIRTHQKSKILSPGILYGSNADSGDGLGYDTIKLIPDATLFSQGSEQHIVVDPTSPGHIHLRAGGPIDNSNAELFLGGELTHVKVSDTSDNVVIKTTNGNGPITNEWNFSSNGQMTFPQGTVLAELVSGPTNAFGIFANGVPGRTALIRTQPSSAGFNYDWEFGNNGVLTLPNTGKVAVTGVTATYLAERETAYNDSQGMYFDAVFQWARIDNSFSPIWFNLPGRLAYDQIISWTPPAGVTPVPANIVVLANACKMNYVVWQEAIADSKLTVKSDTVNWEFDSAGKLTLPQGGVIAGGEDAAIQLAYLAWQEEEAGWQAVITTGGADLNIRPWNFAGPSPEEKLATVTAMWMEQQRPGTILDWVPISAAHYNEARAWLAFTSNTDGYRLWKKLTTGVTITSDGKSWSFTNDGAITLPNSSAIRVDGNNLEIGGMTNFNIEASGVVNIYTDTEGVAPFQWQFGTDGGLTLPGNITFSDATVQTTAWAGSVDWDNVTNTPAISSADTGNITFDDNLIQGNPLGTVGIKVTVNSNYLNATIQNSNVFALSKSADTDQVQIGWIIQGSGGGPQPITNKTDGGSYWMFYVAGGISTTYPITIESADYQLGSGAQLILAVDPGDSLVKSWVFDPDGSVTFPDASVQNTAFTGNATSVDITDTNGLDTNYYLTFVENRDSGEILRADVDLTFNSADNTLSAGNITATGNITAQNFTGNISITGNVTGTSPNVELVAGDYTWTFDNTGVFTLPAGAGAGAGLEGGELQLTQAADSTLAGTGVIIDSYGDTVRFFESGSPNKGAYIDLTTCSNNVSTLLNNRVSGYVDAGTFVTMDNIKVTVTASGLRGLSLASVSGSFAASISGTYTLYSGGVNGAGGGLSVTTTPSTSLFGWSFISQGDTSTYILNDTTNIRAYRITMMIGDTYLNNIIVIERLI